MSEKTGRPPKFKDVKQLKKLVDDYFNNCDPHTEDVTEWVEARDRSGKLKKDSNGLSYLVEVSHKIMTKQIPYTITGLALALGTTRRTLLDYELLDNEFSHTIKEAKLKCEQYNEMMLYGASPTGTIFNLKNNYNWVDKTEQDLTSKGEQIGAMIVFENPTKQED